jgi:hypothetical protein
MCDRDVGSDPTGALHHVALCTGYDEMVARKGRGAHDPRNEVKPVGLRQIFTLDPNGILLELNFFGD